MTAWFAGCADRCAAGAWYFPVTAFRSTFIGASGMTCLLRFSGPMTFRFFSQRTMAGIAALHDGINDTAEVPRSFFWTAHSDPTQQAGRLREGFISVARILLLGISMDVIYQFRN